LRCGCSLRLVAVSVVRKWEAARESECNLTLIPETDASACALARVTDAGFVRKRN
jgi:hypothetical protein